MVSEKLSPKISDPLQKWIIPLTYPSDHDYLMNHFNDESGYANINLYFILRIVFFTHPFSHSILHLTHPLLARSTFMFGSGMWNRFTLWIETDCNNKYLSKMEMLQQAIFYCYVTHYWCAERLSLCSSLEFSVRFGNYRLKHFMMWLNDRYVECMCEIKCFT
jgi:hypothetical protein